jgi:hypothetical protein
MTISPWNRGHIIGQKRPLQISHIWGIRICLELERKVRDLALFLHFCVIVLAHIGPMLIEHFLKHCDVASGSKQMPTFYSRHLNASDSGLRLMHQWRFVVPPLRS